jgi:hypothetical protein
MRKRGEDEGRRQSGELCENSNASNVFEEGGGVGKPGMVGSEELMQNHSDCLDEDGEDCKANMDCLKA